MNIIMENNNLTFNNKVYKTQTAFKFAQTRHHKSGIQRLDRLIENKYRKTEGESKENNAERKRLTKEFNLLIDEEIAIKTAKKELAKQKLWDKTHLMTNEMFIKKQQSKAIRTQKLLDSSDLINQYGIKEGIIAKNDNFTMRL